MNTPLVSVLITAYNREQYIAEAIESVLKSTYHNFEIIIVDDCSVDKTVSIAKTYVEKDSRIRLYVNEKNLGDYNNRNKAASYAEGKYLKYLDSDDVIFPWGLQTMVYSMELFPNAALGMCSTVSVNSRFPILLSPVEAYQQYYFKNRVLNIGPSGTIIRRDIFLKYDGFSGSNYIGDTELWLTIAQENSIVYLPPNLIYWREHEDQQIAVERKTYDIEKIRFDLDIKMLSSKNCPLSSSEAKAIMRNLKNIKCRTIAKDFFLSGKLNQSYKRKKRLSLSFVDFIISLKHNFKIPSSVI